MAFEVTNRDLLGRIGRVETKSGTVETPHLFPVINALVQPIPPHEILEEFRCNAVMTNAYLVKKNFASEATAKGIHGLLDYRGVVATDSGAYQILQYGSVEVDPVEIAKFQEEINSDIAVILDVPTGWQIDRAHAEWTVKETLRRADETLGNLRRQDILWEGPIQGGTYLDLVAASAKKMSQRPFAICSLGSPTPLMERYIFDKLVDMIGVAKSNIPLSKPLHLFGAGHPMMFALAVALGCDLFDSASYALFARQGRYMTTTGSHRLHDLKYLPCSCPACQGTEPTELLSLDSESREKILARHNLHVCLEEIRRIKQAIIEGRLWELLEIRARAHPSIMKALTRLTEYADLVERHSPSTKRKGLLYLGDTSLSRPEVRRHTERLLRNYAPPQRDRILLLIPQPSHRPYHSAPEVGRMREVLPRGSYGIVFYGPPYGAVPIEIDDVYPLSQTEAFTELGYRTIENSVDIVVRFVESKRYSKILLYTSGEHAKMLKRRLTRTCRASDRELTVVDGGSSLWSDRALRRLSSRLRTLLEDL